MPKNNQNHEYPLGDLIVRLFFRPARHKAQLVLDIGPVESKKLPIQERTKMAYVISADKKVKVSINPKDSYGNIGRIDSTQHAPIWSVSDPALMTVTPADDGLSAYFTPVGPVGSVQGSVAADVDLGDGVQDLNGVIDFTIVAGQVVDLGTTTGPMEPR